MKHLIFFGFALGLSLGAATAIFASPVPADEKAVWFEGVGFRPPSDCTFDLSPLHKKDGDNYWVPLGFSWVCVDTPYGNGKAPVGLKKVETPPSFWQPLVGAMPVVGTLGSLIYEKGTQSLSYGPSGVGGGNTGGGGHNCECGPNIPPIIPSPPSPVPLPTSILMMLSALFLLFRRRILSLF